MDSFEAARRVRQPLGRARACNAPLAVATGIFMLALTGTLIAFVVDHRAIAAAPAWAPLTTFMVRGATYAGTLIWFLSFVRGHRRLVRAASWTSAVAPVAADSPSAPRAARGAPSPYNNSTLTQRRHRRRHVRTDRRSLGWLLRLRIGDQAVVRSLRLGL